MKTCTKIRVVALTLVFAFVAAFCGCFVTACKKDNDDGENGDKTNVGVLESKYLSLTSSVVTDDNGENVYTINAIVKPDSLTPRWVIVWENPDSDWASGRNVNDYISLEISNNDKTAKLSAKQAFGETAVLTATIGSGANAVFARKILGYNIRPVCSYYAGNNAWSAGYYVTGVCDTFTKSDTLVIPSTYLGNPIIGVYDFLGDSGGFSSSGIKKLVVGENVVTISGGSFSEISTLESVEFLSDYICLDTYAFKGCNSLREVKFLGDDCRLNSLCFSYCRSLISVTFPKKLITVGGMSFVGCSSLETIIIPASVTSIAFGAFRDCVSLKNVTFLGDKSKITIATDAFNGCPYQP